MIIDSDGDLNEELVAAPAVLAAYREFAGNRTHWDIPGDTGFLAGWKAAIAKVHEELRIF